MRESLVEVRICKGTRALIIEPGALEKLLCGGTILWVFLKASKDEPDSLWRDLLVDAAQDGVLSKHLLFDLIEVIGLPELSSRQHLICHYTERPDIDFERVLFTLPKLRGHVESRPELHSQRLIVFVVKSAKSEISQLDSNFVWFLVVWFLDEHILRFDVSVGNLHGLV